MNPNTPPTDWEQRFLSLWDAALKRFRSGRTSPATLFEPAEVQFLASIGCTAQELFDFIEDHAHGGDPEPRTVLEVQRIRLAYLSQPATSARTVPAVDPRRIPAKTDAVEGIAWLPRLIAKARLKLRGELPPELMYGCGGDRPFLRRVGISLPDFLQLTWDSGTDSAPIVAAVKQKLR